MRVILSKPVYVGTTLYKVPTETVRGAEIYKPVEVDLVDDAARDLIADGTARPAGESARTAVDPSQGFARKAVRLET